MTSENKTDSKAARRDHPKAVPTEGTRSGPGGTLEPASWLKRVRIDPTTGAFVITAEGIQRPAADYHPELGDILVEGAA